MKSPQKSKDLINFLFGTSQQESLEEAQGEDMVKIFEDIDVLEFYENHVDDLFKALKSVGVVLKKEDIEVTPTGLKVCDRNITKLLNDPEKFGKILELGYVPVHSVVDTEDNYLFICNTEKDLDEKESKAADIDRALNVTDEEYKKLRKSKNVDVDIEKLVDQMIKDEGK
jgi:hypothetical protein